MAETDIFSRQNKFGGVMSPEGASLIFSGANGVDGLGASESGGVGLVTQNANVGYSQSFTEFYELGTSSKYYVAGRTSGQIGVQRILGPRAVSVAFYRKYGNLCNMAANNLSLRASTACNPGGANASQLNFLMRTVFINALQFNAASQNNVLNEGLQGVFSSLDLN